MMYENAYAEYQEARRALYRSRAKYDEISGRLDETIKEEQAASEAESHFRQKKETLTRQRTDHENTVQSERENMKNRVPPEPQISAEEYRIEKKPLIQESVQGMDALRFVKTEEYSEWEKSVKQVVSAEKTRRLAGKEQLTEISLENYQELRDDLEQAEKQHTEEVEKREYPRNLDALWSLSGETREYVTAKVNESLAARGLGTVEEVENRKQRLDARKAEEAQRRKEQFAGLHLSTKLTSAEEIKKRDPDLVRIMKENLNRMIEGIPESEKTKLGGVNTVDALLGEEAELNQKEAGWKSRKEDEKLRLLYDGFTFTKLNDEKSEEKRQGIEAEINRMLREHPMAGGASRPVSTLEEYYAAVREEKQKQEELERQRKEPFQPLPEKLDDMLKQRDRLELAPELKQLLTGYDEARTKRAELQAAAEKLPETFTNLEKKKSDPQLYQGITEQIDRIIAAKGGTSTGVQNLQEYFQLEKQSGEIGKAAATREEAEIKANAATSKREIKEWIAAYNKSLPKKNPELDTARKNERAAGTRLVEAVKKYNKAKEKERADGISASETELEALKAANKVKKAFIKDEVIQGAIKKEEKDIAILRENHEAHKKQIDSMIKSYNRDHRAAHKRAEKAEFHIGGTSLKDEEKAYGDVRRQVNAVLKEERDKQKKDQGLQSSWQDSDRRFDERKTGLEGAMKRQRSGLEALIRAENDRRKELNKEIGRLEEQSRQSFGDGYNALVNKEIEKLRGEKHADAKSAYREAAVRKKTLGAACQVLGNLNAQFRDLIAMATEAAIRAEEEGLQQNKSRLVDELHSVQQTQMRTTNAAARRLDGADRQQEPTEGRRQVNLDQVVERENRLESFEARRRELEGQIFSLNRQISTVQAEMPDRIRENRESIHEIFREGQGFDGEGQRRAEDVIHSISLDLAKNDQQRQLEEARKGQREKKLDDLINEDQEASARLKDSISRIEAGSGKLKKMFTEDSLNKIDTIVKVGEGIANFVIDRVNSASGEAEKKEHIDIGKTLGDLKESLLGEDAPKEHTALQILEIGKLVYGKMDEAAKDLYAKYQEASRDFDIAEMGYEDLLDEEEAFKAFQEEDARKNPDSNLLKQWDAFYEQCRQSGVEMLEENIRTAEEAENKAGVYKNEAADREAGVRAELAGQEERIRADQELLSGKKAEMRAAFSQTVLENGAKDNGPVVLTRDDVFAENGPDDFTFLSRLTGMPLSGETDLDKAMNAFGKIHINGINAVSYFNLAERWQNASFGDPENPEIQQERKNLVSGLAYYGNCIKESLKAAFDENVGQELRGTAKELAGQMIAVENGGLTLSALELRNGEQNAMPREPEKPVLKEHVDGWFKSKQNKAIDEENRAVQESYERSMDAYKQEMAQYREANKGIERFNRQSRMTSEGFNQMRLTAARTELPSRRSEVVQGEPSLAAELSPDQKLAKAVHRSRDTSKSYGAKQIGGMGSRR